MSAIVPGLQALFLLLRDAGVTVGVEEVRRLAAIFAMEPELDEAGLRRVVETILVKSLEERAVFDRVYRRWLDAMDRHIGEREARAAKGARKRAQKAALARDRAAADEGAAGGEAAAVMMELAPASHAAQGAPAPPPPSAAAIVDFSAPLAKAQAATMAQHTAAAAAMQSEGKRMRGLHATLATSKIGWTKLVLAALTTTTMLLVVLGLWKLLPMGSSKGMETVEGADAGASERNTIEPTMRAHPDELVTYRPELVVSEQPAPPTNYPAYALIALCVLVAGGLWLSRGRGRRVPVPRLPRERGRRAQRARRRAPRRAEGLILDERDEEDLVWGVGRFVSDEQGRDLDVDRTVDDTASAFGRPVLRYQAARHQREAWLWVDESLDTPVARHLASDLATMLERSGLPVVRASFWGIPENLHVDEGDEDINVDAFDARRDSAAVAILSDGRLLAAAHRARNRRDDVHRLLRNLSFWPRVTFIDFGRGELRAIAGPHGLSVIQPHDAPAAISELSASVPWRDPGQLFGDARVWAAACVLTPLPVTHRTALSLRRALGIKVSPWALEVMRDSAERDAGGLTWPAEYRAELLSWLVRAQELPGAVGPVQSSLLARVVDAWQALLDERERAQRKLARQHGIAWQGSDEAVELQLERGMIGLWTQPDRAAAGLYRLARAGHGERIRHYLRELAPRECEGRVQGAIILPWRLRDVRRATQVWLREMGFASRAGTWPGHQGMPRPARLWLAVGLCAGLALGAAGALIEDSRATSKREPVLSEGEAPGKSYVYMDGRVYKAPEPELGVEWRVQAGSLWLDRPETLGVKANQQVTTTWHEFTVPCIEERDGVAVHRCTSEGKAPETSRERWSIAVITRQDDDLARNLGRELLDSGSVDGVFLVSEPVDTDALGLDRLGRPGDQGKDDQLLMIVPSEPWPDTSAYPGRATVLSFNDLGTLSGILDFERGQEKTLAEALEAAGRGELRYAPGSDPGNFVVRGLGECGARGERCCDGLCDDELDECVKGVCVERPPEPPEPICDPGATRCDGNAVETCTEAGTAWANRDDCGADRICQGGQCMPRKCELGEAICTPDGLARRVCNQRGTGYKKRACGSGKLCTAGACQRIRGAYITFDPVQIKVPPQLKQAKPYVACGSVGKEVESLESSRRVRYFVDYRPESPWSFTVQCRLLARRPGKMDRPPGNSDLRVLQKSRKTHPWDLSSERGTHRQTLRVQLFDDKDRGSIRVEVRYTIDIKLAGRDVRPEQDSADAQ